MHRTATATKTFYIESLLTGIGIAILSMAAASSAHPLPPPRMLERRVFVQYAQMEREC